jgi:uncharacterized membrane protein
MKSIHQFLQKPWLYLVIIIIGISLKFYHLNNRVFWYDEVCTIVHTSGIPLYEYDALIPANKITNVQEYRRWIELKKNDLSMGQELKGLFTSTNLNPLHYPFLMVWYRLIGDKPLHYRLFSVFMFLVSLPLLFFLARKLFESSLAGWIAVSLFSVAPMIQFFSQEARYMTLMIFFLLASNYFLLIAAQRNKWKWWIVYMLVSVLALYTSVLSGLVLFGHLIYILWIKRKVWLKYSLILLAILLLYSPWIYSMLIHRHEIIFSLSWQKHILSNISFFKPFFYHLLGFACTFSYFDHSALREIVLENKILENWLIILIDVLIAIFIIYAIIYTLRRIKKWQAWFMALIFFPHLIFSLLTDLIRGAIGSIFFRYHTTIFIGLILFIAFLISDKLIRARFAFLLFYIAIIFISLLSSFRITRNPCFWVSGCEPAMQTAKELSNSEFPLVITGYATPVEPRLAGFMVTLIESDWKNMDILRADPDIENVKDLIKGHEYTDIYICYASDELVDNLKIQLGEENIKKIDLPGNFPVWRIKF